MKKFKFLSKIKETLMKIVKKMIGFVKKHKKICIVVSLALIVAIAIVCIIGTQVTRTPVKTELPQPESVTIVKQDLATSISVTGTLTSAQTWVLTSGLTDVEVKSVKVKVGDRVKEGDIIVELDESDANLLLQNAETNLTVITEKNKRDITSADRALKDTQTTAQVESQRAVENTQKARNELIEAKSQSETETKELNSARSALDGLEKEAKAVQETVNKAKDNSRDASKKYSEAQAAFEKANEELEIKKVELEQAQKALEEKKQNVDADTSEQEVKLAEAQEAYNQALNVQNAAEKILNKAETDNENAANSLGDAQSKLSSIQAALAEAESQVQVKESDVKTAADTIKINQDTLEKAQQAQDDLKRSGNKSVADAQDVLSDAKSSQLTSIQNAEMDVKKYEVLVESAVIKAPADGIVTEIAVQEGEVYKGEKILVIQDDSSFKVAANIDQYDIGSIANGQNARITLQSGGDKEFSGKVTFVSPIPMDISGVSDTKGSTATPQYPIEVTIDKIDETLRIGMNTKLTVYTKEVKDALTVPMEFVQTDENGEAYVMVLDNNGIEQKVEVEYGLMTDYYVQIKGKGLGEGMKVLASSTSTSPVVVENAGNEMSGEEMLY